MESNSKFVRANYALTIDQLSCMAADVVLLYSQYNMTSFLHSMDSLFKMMPKDQCPIINNLRSLIGSKSHVLYFPIDFSIIRDSLQRVFIKTV